MSKRSAPILLICAAALAIGLSGCGASKVKAALDPVAAAAANSASAKTVHISMTMREQMPGLSTPVTITAEGAESFADRRVSMQMDMSAIALMAGGRLGSPYDWKIEAVMDGLVMYMRAPFFQTALHVDKPWVKIDLEDAGKQAGIDLSAFTTYSPSTWTQGLDYLRGSTNAHVVGHEKIRGVSTTHYQAHIDFDLYLDQLPSDQRSAAKKALDALREQGDPQYGPFDIWIDAQNRVRRVTFSLSMTVAGSSQPLEMSMEMDLYDYDTPVSIIIPPADQTVDLMQVAGSLGSS